MLDFKCYNLAESVRLVQGACNNKIAKTFLQSRQKLHNRNILIFSPTHTQKKTSFKFLTKNMYGGQLVELIQVSMQHMRFT